MKPINKLSYPRVIRQTNQRRAALLLCQGIELIDCKPLANGYLEFTFDNTDDKAILAGAAISANKPLPIGDYLAALTKIGELVHQFKTVQRYGIGSETDEEGGQQ